MRAVIYTRFSAADAGVKESDVVARLRRFAVEVKGWQVVAELSDSKPYPDGERSSVVRLSKLVREGGVDVVVTDRLSRLVRNLRHLATFAALLREHGVELVAEQDAIHTTELVGRAEFLGAAKLLERIEKEQRSEAAKVGHIRAALKNGGEAFGRPKALINPLELLGYWRGYPGQRPLSIKAIAKKLEHSEGVIRKAIRELREDGKVDDELRARNLAAAGGLPKGGRPSKAKPVKDDELLLLFQGPRPVSLQTIATRYVMSRAKLAQHLDRLEKAGLLNRAQRAANMRAKK